MSTLKKLTQDEMFLISGGKRCSDNSKPSSEKRQRTEFEKNMSTKAEKHGTAGKVSGVADAIGSAIGRSWGC